MGAHSTPCLFLPKNLGPAVVFNNQAPGIYAVGPASGKVILWDDKALDKRTVSSPVIAGDIILGSCGSGGGGNFVSAIRAGDLSMARQPELAWQLKKSAPYVPTGIAYGDLIWLWADGGIVTCVQAKTGAVRY